MSTLLSILAAETGLSERDLLRLSHTAPNRYKVFFIPKRSGGMREIAQPARELKLVQRAIVTSIISKLPVHPSAAAYRPGRSIRDNATVHAGSSPILKMDFRDFFPSIKAKDWVSYCRRHGIIGEADLRLSALFLFRQPNNGGGLCLSIGAPSSPALSNVLLYDFDVEIAVEAERRGISYTRYADDLTFSGQRIGMLRDMVDVVRKTVRKFDSPKLAVNQDKTTFITTARRRSVTGVVLANDGTVSLGRDRKRRISAQVHHASLNRLTKDQLQELSGHLAFAQMIEPKFVERLGAKYGEGVISKIKEAATVRRAPPNVSDLL